ncbi:MAG: AAA family ATPase [Dysgonomonas sp.]|nr:AAA family ATPase [Dysgonomonas sp.]
MIYIEKIRNRHIYQEGEDYPYNISSLKKLKELSFRKAVTFIIGENGSGKSTLIEAIAINAGFNPEGGGRNFSFKTNETHSSLFEDLLLIRSPYRNKDGYFLRAESVYNLASNLEEMNRESGGAFAPYGNKSLHNQSHGESFLNIFINRLYGTGLYVLDEPEAALSLQSMFTFLIRMKQLVDLKSQFIIATHSPILLAYPDADIYTVTENGLQLTAYEETEQYKQTKYFLNNHTKMIKELFNDQTLP